jgi:glutaredoxin-like protein NrdH
VGKPVVVYSKYRCIQCDMTKRWLKDNDVSFMEYNVEDDYEALMFVSQQGFMAAPVVFWGSDSWSGFQPDKLKQNFDAEN